MSGWTAPGHWPRPAAGSAPRRRPAGRRSVYAGALSTVTAKGQGSRLACARSVGNDPYGDKSLSSGGVQDVAVTVQFTFGTVFTLGSPMVADGTAQSSLSAYKITLGGGASGTADLSHTLL